MCAVHKGHATHSFSLHGLFQGVHQVRRDPDQVVVVSLHSHYQQNVIMPNHALIISFFYGKFINSSVYENWCPKYKNDFTVLKNLKNGATLMSNKVIFEHFLGRISFISNKNIFFQRYRMFNIFVGNHNSIVA